MRPHRPSWLHPELGGCAPGCGGCEDAKILEALVRERKLIADHLRRIARKNIEGKPFAIAFGAGILLSFADYIERGEYERMGASP